MQELRFDVEQRSPFREMDVDEGSLGSACRSERRRPVADHHDRQPRLFVIQRANPGIQRSQLRLLHPPGHLVGKPELGLSQVLQQATARRARLAHVTHIPDVPGVGQRINCKAAGFDARFVVQFGLYPAKI